MVYLHHILQLIFMNCLFAFSVYSHWNNSTVSVDYKYICGKNNIHIEVAAKFLCNAIDLAISINY